MPVIETPTIEVHSRIPGSSTPVTPPVRIVVHGLRVTVRTLIVKAVEATMAGTGARVWDAGGPAAGGIPTKAVSTRSMAAEAERACAAFAAGVFVLFVGGHQASTLDEEVRLGPVDRVTFLRLTPLVGG